MQSESVGRLSLSKKRVHMRVVRFVYGCRFWKLLSGLLATRRLCRLPLWSDFSQGFGDAVYSQGKKITDVPWYNLAVQSSQPTVIWGSKEDNSSDSKYGVIALGLKDAFEGGSSLLLEACLPSSAEVSLFDLFQTRVPVSESLVVLYTWKPQGHGVDFFIDVKMENKNSVRTLRLCSENESAVKSRDEESGCVRLGPISEGDLEGILQDRGMLDGNQYGWRTRCFLVNCGQDGEVLHGVGAGILLRQARSRLVSVLLGKLQVLPLSVCRQPSPEVTNLTFHPPGRYPAKGAPSQGPLSERPLSERPLSEDPEAGRECHSRAWLTWDITRSDLVDYYSVYRGDFGSLETGTEDADTGDWVLLGHSVSRVFCLPAGVSAPPTLTTAPPSPSTTAPPSPATIPASVLVQPVSRSGFRPRLSVCPVLQLSEPRS